MTRGSILDHVQENPGVHFNAIARDLDLAPGQVQYHLRGLEDDGEVVEERLYGRTHYYTPGYGDWERGAIAVLRRETARDVLVRLMAEGPRSPADVADSLGVARSTLEWHLDHLVEQDIVAKGRAADGGVTLSLEHPEETARMLRLVEPSTADRLVDRFTRLFDDLLAGGGGDGADGRR